MNWHEDSSSFQWWLRYEFINSYSLVSFVTDVLVDLTILSVGAIGIGLRFLLCRLPVTLVSWCAISWEPPGCFFVIFNGPVMGYSILSTRPLVL